MAIAIKQEVIQEVKKRYDPVPLFIHIHNLLVWKAHVCNETKKIIGFFSTSGMHNSSSGGPSDYFIQTQAFT